MGAHGGGLPCHQEGLVSSFWQRPTARLVLARHEAVFRQPHVLGAASLVTGTGLEAAPGAGGTLGCHLQGGPRSLCDPEASISRDKGSASSTARALQLQTNLSRAGVGRAQ